MEYIHFIDLTIPDSLVSATTFRKISIKQDSVNISWSQPFHLVSTELFNKNYYLTVVQNLSCFYDDAHFCLCYNYDQKCLANCFNFDHNMANDCSGQNVCENDAQCLQDRPDSPTR